MLPLDKSTLFPAKPPSMLLLLCFVFINNFFLSVSQGSPQFNVVLATTRKPFFVPSQRRDVTISDDVTNTTPKYESDVIYSEENFDSFYDEFGEENIEDYSRSFENVYEDGNVS